MTGFKDRIFTPETKAKISAASRGNQRCRGKTLSAETKAKISAKVSAYWASKNDGT